MAADTKLVVMLKLDGTELGKGISRAQADIAKLGAAFSGIGVAASAAVKFAATFQDQTIKAARAAGTTAAEFSKMSYAAGMSGVSADLLGKSLNKLNVPTDSMKSAFQQMGLSMKDASGKMKGQEQLLAEISDGMTNLKDPTSKTTAATMIFGEEGAKMVSMLESGSKAMREAAKEAEAFGQVVSDKAGKNAELFNDNLSKVEKGLTGLRNVVSETAIEMVNQSHAVEAVQDALKGAIAWWRGLSKETQSTVMKVVAVTAAFGGLLLTFSAIAAAAPAIAAGFALMLGPIGLVVMAIAGLSAAFLALESSRLQALTGAERFSKAFEEQNRTFENAGGLYRELEGRSASLAIKNADVRKAVTELDDVTKKYNVSLVDQNGNYKKISAVIDEVNQARVREAAINLAALGILEQKTRAEITALQTMVDNTPGILKYTDTYRIANATLEQRKKQLEEVTKNEIQLGRAIQEANRKAEPPKAKGGRTVENKPIVPPEILFRSELLDSIAVIDKSRTQSGEKHKAINEQLTKDQLAIMEGAPGISMAYAKMAEKLANIAGNIVKPFADLTDTIAKGIEYDSQVALRDLDVVANRATEVYAQQRAAMEAEETAKIAALESSYDSQIQAVQDGEDAKTRALEAGANARLLAADAEYAAALEKLNQSYAAQLAADQADYEMKTAILDQRALDKEQRQLTEDIMQADRDALAQLREQEHQKAIADLAGLYADKKKGIDNDQKAAEKTNAENNKIIIEELTKNKNAALEAAEADKNAKLLALDKARAAQEKDIEKQRLETQYKAQMDAFNATKGVKIAETIASGAAAAAQAFAAAMAATAPILPLGLALGGTLAGVILTTTAMRVGQISSQAPIKPAGLLEDGGVIGGNMTHAQGGIPANVESGEMFIDRRRTAKMLGFIDNATSGGGGVTINIQAGAIQGDIRDEATLTKLATKLGQLVSRRMVFAT